MLSIKDSPRLHSSADCSVGKLGKALLRSSWSTSWWAIRRWRRDRQAVAALHALDERTLKDVGIERSEIESVVHGLGRDASRVGRTQPPCPRHFAAN